MLLAVASFSGLLFDALVELELTSVSPVSFPFTIDSTLFFIYKFSSNQMIVLSLPWPIFSPS